MMKGGNTVFDSDKTFFIILNHQNQNPDILIYVCKVPLRNGAAMK